jgi:WD40 repeat protein
MGLGVPSPIGDGSAIMKLHFSPTNDSRLVSVSNSSMKHWDVDTGQLYRVYPGNHCSEFSPDGRTIAMARNDNCVHLIDAESGDLRRRLVDGAHSCTIAWSPDGSKLASTSYDRDRAIISNCKVWDVNTGGILRTIELKGTCCSLSWGRDRVRDRERETAFAMGHHPRLGGESGVLELETGVVKMIVDALATGS